MNRAPAPKESNRQEESARRQEREAIQAQIKGILSSAKKIETETDSYGIEVGEDVVNADIGELRRQASLLEEQLRRLEEQENK